MKTMRFKSSLTRACCLVAALTLLSCSHKPPTHRNVERACRQEITAFTQKNPLRQIEANLSPNQQARDLLSIDSLVTLDFREESSSATSVEYLYLFEFQNKLGKPIVISNALNTRERRRVTPKSVKVQFRCELTWNLFKGKAIKSKISVITPTVKH